MASTDIAPADRGRAERRLAELERVIADIEDVAGIGIWEWDAATDTIVWSERQRMLHGIPDEAPPSDFQAFLRFVHPDDRKRVVSEVAELQRTGHPFKLRYRVVLAGGEVRWLMGHGRMLTNEAGEPVRMVGTSQDLTELHEAQEALRASEESYRTIFELASEALFVHDPETGAVLDANRAACELHGVTLEQMKAGGVAEVSAGEAPFDGEHALQLIHRAAAGESPRFEWLGRHTDGSKVWVEVSLNRATILGAERVLASVRNITERKAKEEAERAREAAELANRAKSEFLSRMSHELRTPMNSILGFAQVLERGDLPAAHAKSVQHILRAGRHLLHLINEILEIARIETGRHNLSLEPVRIGTVLRDALAMVKPLAAQWSVRLEEPPATECDRFVHADRQRLAQVLLNLLSNAIKYNIAGGSVRIACGVAPDQDSAEDSAERVVVRVQDTGRGIDTDKLDQLFVPFARLGAERSDVDGTGLGLALSQRLTEAMGGSLRLERTGPAGSVFVLELRSAHDPLQRIDYATVGARRDDEPAHAAATLLYIEDNLANLSLVETILVSRPAWRILPALQGQLGIELARQHRPDLILLDLHLPDMRGDEVLRRLRADARTADIPVVMISADATRSTIERMLEAGAAAFLTKPIDIDEFLDTVESQLDRPGRRS